MAPDPHLISTLLVIASDFDALGCTAHANVVRRAIMHIETLDAENARVNEHRKTAQLARVRAADYAQATRWLRGRIKVLERLVDQLTPRGRDPR